MENIKKKQLLHLLQENVGLLCVATVILATVMWLVGYKFLSLCCIGIGVIGIVKFQNKSNKDSNRTITALLHVLPEKIDFGDPKTIEIYKELPERGRLAVLIRTETKELESLLRKKDEGLDKVFIFALIQAKKALGERIDEQTWKRLPLYDEDGEVDNAFIEFLKDRDPAQGMRFLKKFYKESEIIRFLVENMDVEQVRPVSPLLQDFIQDAYWRSPVTLKIMTNLIRKWGK